MAKLHRRVHSRVRHHYFRVMPDNRQHRVTIWAVFWVASGIILSQLIYPPERALPTATLLGEPQGWESDIALAARISKLFDETQVRLIVGDHHVEVPLKSFGAEPETTAMITRLTDYPFWQRYVPLSIFLRQPQLSEATVSYTNIVAQATCHKYAKQLSSEPRNARIALEDGRLVAVDEEPGHRVDAGNLCRQLQSVAVTLGKVSDVNVEAELIAPATTADDLASVRSQAEAALSAQVELTFDGEVFRPSQSDIAGWLNIGGSSDRPVLQLDQAKVREYLEDINRSIGTVPGTTNVTVVNGVETDRNVGKMGRVIAYDAAIELISEQLIGEAAIRPIALTLRDEPPKLIYNNRYTASEAGLQAYVADVARQYNARIAIQQLDGDMWHAAAREHESTPSASTYKLYVAMKLFDEMKAGRVKWSDSMLDTTVSVCFDRMTIASTNPCAEEWLRQWGRQAMNDYLYDRGFSQGTTFTSTVATHTTAADLTNYMVRLARGELYDDIYKQRLLASLGNHPFPYGIPTGSTGKVHDKVGFLWDYVHDTAIVEHLRGRYVMTIMTKGQSYARIASITREVERIMYD